MHKYNTSVHSSLRVFLKSNNYLQLIKDLLSGQKTLDVDIWMLAPLLLLHLHLPGSIKHCHSLHTCHAFNSLFRERWGFIASITQQGICMRTLTDRYIKIYRFIHIQTKNIFILVIYSLKKGLHKE